jgi:hypothetical protein
VSVFARCAATLSVGFAAALAIGSAGGAEGARLATVQTLYVNYTMNCTFTITDGAAGPVTSLAPGTYLVEVNTPVVFGGVDGGSDMTACNGYVQFQLTGPGVDLSTTLDDGDEQEESQVAIFQPSSTYTAQDNNQPSVAVSTFTTLASAPAGATTLGNSGATISAAGSMPSAGTSSSKASAHSTASVPDRNQMTALFTIDHYKGSAPTYAGLMRYVQPFQKILTGCRIGADELTNTMIDLANQASSIGGRNVSTLAMLQAVARRVVWKGRRGCGEVFDVAEANQEAGRP